MIVLEINNFTMQFGGLTAVNRFDMEVREGEIVARAPESEWPQWDSAFQLIFQTFVPWDCGGV